MRSLVLLTAAAAIGAWVVIRQLPEKEAQADAAPALAAQEIQSIALDGGRGLPASALRAALATRVGDMVDDARLERDRVALEGELAARGYLSAHVAPASVTFGRRGGAYIVFDIEPGPMFHLRNVTITGPGRRDAEVVRLASGDEASRDRIARARQSLADTHTRHGGKRVELTVTPDMTAASLDVELATH